MKNIFLVLILITLTGCATQTFTLNQSSNDQPTQETMQNFFFSGIGQSKTIDATAVCGAAANVAKVETITTPLDNVLGFLTAGIYTPRTSKIYCNT